MAPAGFVEFEYSLQAATSANRPSTLVVNPLGPRRFINVHAGRHRDA